MIIELKLALKQATDQPELDVFDWKDVNFPILRLCAAKIQCIFGSTYLCESSFSVLKWVKSKARNRLTDINLEAEMLCALSTFDPNLDKLVRDKSQLQPSH